MPVFNIDLAKTDVKKGTRTIRLPGNSGVSATIANYDEGERVIARMSFDKGAWSKGDADQFAGDNGTLDALSKFIEKANGEDHHFLHYHFDTKKVTKDEKTGMRMLPGIASTEVIDRDRSIVTLDGWKLKSFRANPVFLWAHNWDEPPIGKVDKITKDKVTGRLTFMAIESAANPFAKLIFDQYEAKELRAFSVGFLSLARKYENEAGDEVDPWDAEIIRHTSSELVEISAVPVPANQEALRLMFSKGLGNEKVDSKARISEQSISKGRGVKDALISFDTLLSSAFDGTDAKTLQEQVAAEAALCGESVNYLSMLLSMDQGGDVTEAQAKELLTLKQTVGQLSIDRQSLMSVVKMMVDKFAKW